MFCGCGLNSGSGKELQNLPSISKSLNLNFKN